MRVGMVIGFRDKKDLALALVVEIGPDKVRLLNEKGKEFSFPLDKVLVQTGRVVATTRPRDDLVADLAEGRTAIAELRAQIVLSDLWELLEPSDDTFGLARLTGEYFGPSATGDHRAAMLSELLADSVYFKQKGDEFVVRPRELVQEIFRQKEAEDRRQREREEILAWCRDLARGVSPAKTPESGERYLGLLKTYVLGTDSGPESAEAAAFAKEIGLSDAAGAFDLLVRAGVWTADENLLLHRHQVPTVFGREVLAREAEVEARFVRREGWADQPDRLDLTGVRTFTIDDEDTEDIDDALSLETTDGGFRVGVHIADTAEFVTESDAIDQEAFRRGQTLYLPDRKIQMLPDRLSLRVASLVAAEDHAAISVIVDLDQQAHVRSFAIRRTVIRVSERLSYEQVDGMFESRPDLSAMLGLAEQLRRRRIEAGAIVFNVPDMKVRVDAQGRIKVRKMSNDTRSHTVVSEMMILANRLVAEWLRENKVPSIFRLQAQPDEPIGPVGYDPVMFYRLRRLIKRTEVSSTPRAHAGLGVPAYVQMSSPIRRYADLAIHRQIRGVLAGMGPCYTDDDVRSIINSTERAQEIAGLVQREAHRYWLLKHLRGMVGSRLPGLVLDRRDESYVVQLTDFLFEVTVYQRPEHRYEPGDTLVVEIVDVDPRRGSIRCHDAGRAADPDGAPGGPCATD